MLLSLKLHPIWHRCLSAQGQRSACYTGIYVFITTLHVRSFSPFTPWGGATRKGATRDRRFRISHTVVRCVARRARLVSTIGVHATIHACSSRPVSSSATHRLRVTLRPVGLLNSLGVRLIHGRPGMFRTGTSNRLAGTTGCLTVINPGGSRRTERHTNFCTRHLILATALQNLNAL